MTNRRSRKSPTAPSPDVTRCPWPTAGDPLYLAYHDQEWGVPVHDDRKIFEFLVAGIGARSMRAVAQID